MARIGADRQASAPVRPKRRSVLVAAGAAAAAVVVVVAVAVGPWLATDRVDGRWEATGVTASGQSIGTV